MKAKKLKALEEKKKRIAAGTNNGWLNFLIGCHCHKCDTQILGSYCAVREVLITKEEGCVKEAYEARKAMV